MVQDLVKRRGNWKSKSIIRKEEEAPFHPFKGKREKNLWGVEFPTSIHSPYSSAPGKKKTERDNLHRQGELTPDRAKKKTETRSSVKKIKR